MEKLTISPYKNTRKDTDSTNTAALGSAGGGFDYRVGLVVTLDVLEVNPSLFHTKSKTRETMPPGPGIKTPLSSLLLQFQPVRRQNSLSSSYYAQWDRSGASVADRLTLSLCATFGANMGKNLCTLQPVQAGASREDGELFLEKNGANDDRCCWGHAERGTKKATPKF